MDTPKYGMLLGPSMKIHRQQFRECCKLNGIYVLYRAPKPNKHWTFYGEIDSNYEEPKLIGVLFHDHPEQKTLRKMGWMSELQEGASLIEVDYDLEGLQQGALFFVPSGLDDGKARLFRVTSISNSMIYPASVTCEIVPEYEDTYEKDKAEDYSKGSLTLLNDEYDRVFDPEEFLKHECDLV